MIIIYVITHSYNLHVKLTLPSFNQIVKQRAIPAVSL